MGDHVGGGGHVCNISYTIVLVAQAKRSGILFVLCLSCSVLNPHVKPPPST